MIANQQDINSLTLKNLTKGIVWELQENDIIRMWNAAEKEQDLLESARHYIDIIHAAFEMEEIKVDNPKIIAKYEARGMKVAELPYGECTKKWGIKKRPILRVTDLSYENIRHISATKLLEVIDRNFGGGWDSLSQTIQDIILSGFDISTTTLPTDRLHNPGGMYEKMLADDFEVLEIAKGTWTEAIFAKEKPLVEKPSSLLDDDDTKFKFGDDEDNDDDDIDDMPTNGYDDDDDDDIDEDELTAESYRTTIDTNPEDLDITVDDLDDDEY